MKLSFYVCQMSFVSLGKLLKAQNCQREKKQKQKPREDRVRGLLSRMSPGTKNLASQWSEDVWQMIQEERT